VIVDLRRRLDGTSDSYITSEARSCLVGKSVLIVIKLETIIGHDLGFMYTCLVLLSPRDLGLECKIDLGANRKRIQTSY